MKKGLAYSTRYMEGFVTKEDRAGLLPELQKARDLIKKRNGLGHDFLDWMDIPVSTKKSTIDDIKETAEKLNDISDVIVVIGIGGSYLGARTAIEALASVPARKKIRFAGHNLSEDYLSDLLIELKDKEISVNVISKSGGTTEPAIAFRIIEEFLKKKYGPEKIKERIVCTTDKAKGTLRSIADKKGYKSFVIPDGIGGRFSVLTPVGLLPIACAGINIEEILAGAGEQRESLEKCDIEKNSVYEYAMIRNLMYRKGKKIEIFSSFGYKLHYMSEWWKQLFGESEGKENWGIFPASCDFSTDLHAMGQLIQEGERNLFETFIIPDGEKGEVIIPKTEDNLDNLNYLAGTRLDQVNQKAYEAASAAHFEGGVPNSTISIPEVSPNYIGQLFYFFEKAVTISAYISGVNPFDQPGVEAYKNKMFKLLGKPE
ncbi:MAG: glucose-6-phosphate isomerase [Candidatus Aadella gelida]|nr:glucose-6-phosphate isomerase [Candidatus Aadella gelida]